MVTMKDIANAVGVSATTVSNVIRGNAGRVSPEMIARINRAIQEMHYAPNLSARSLVSCSSHIVGVINHSPPMEDGFFQNPFYSALLTGIERLLRERGYYLMTRAVGSTSELHGLLSNWNLDGLILTGDFPAAFCQELNRQPAPLLLVDSYKQADLPQIRLEDRKGGYIATRHLLEMGHRRILFCGAPTQEPGVPHERYEGYKQALVEFGLTPRLEDVYSLDIDIENSLALGRELASRHDYTAIFAMADVLAAGLITGLCENGRRVPDDVSIVGFDDLNIARLINPQLTTVHQDVLLRGYQAAELLVSAIERGARVERSLAMPVRLVERKSVRRV